MRRFLLGAVGTMLLFSVLSATGLASAPQAQRASSAGWNPYATPTRDTLRAFVLIGKAGEFVERRHRRCRSRSVHSTYSHDAPSAELLALLGILRQPAESEDRLSREALHDLPGVGVYSDSVRVARDISGHEFYVYGSHDLADFTDGPPACGELEHRRLERLLVGKPRRLAGLARRIQTSFAQGKSPTRLPAPSETISLFERGPKSTVSNGVGDGASYNVAALRTQGVWLSSYNASGLFTLLVPDGVATITAIFPRVGRKPPRSHRQVYDERTERTVSVRENLASFRSPRQGWDLYPTRVIWRATDGSVIRTTPPPAFWWMF
ncbi:MAG TPA: hypothetical protein VKB03_00950 [Conexibacter sp.]|nr:hypothetical protein [Conexibacter sp.]